MTESGHIQTEQLERFKTLLLKWAGQWFPESRRTELERAFWRSIDKYGDRQDVSGFLDLLEDNPSETLKNEVIQEILVGETYFFRDQALWSNLERTILPDIISHKFGTKSIKIWSAGCSTGEEPYSLALILQQAFTAIDSWKISILATDISEVALNRARLGIYGQRAIREIDDQRWSSWYYRYGKNIQMKESRMNLIKLQRQNIIELKFPHRKTKGTQ
ncbi:hypothetical protein IJT17_05780, partial [bacterium]|nr:hypothetical protein [bacterium]